MQEVKYSENVLQAHISVFRFCNVWPKIGRENDKFFKWKSLFLCLFYGLIGYGDVYHLTYNLYCMYLE